MEPIYKDGWVGFYGDVYRRLLEEVPWGDFTDARRECFMAKEPTSYTYGRGRGVRTYHSTEMHPVVECLQACLNTDGASYNVCFLNRYDNESNHLGWHSDDSDGTAHDHPIAVVSIGTVREIWWRPIGHKGVIPPEWRKQLGAGSLFVMPAGFQQLYQHRIPKGDHVMTEPRISLTFRRINR